MKRLVTGAPATVGYLVILVVAAAVTGPLNGPSATVLRATSTGYYEVTAYGRWWTPLTSVFFTHNLVELIAVVVIGALCIGLAEHRLGTRRTVIIGLVSVSIATLLGIGVQALGILQGELWSRDVHEFQVVDPFALIVAVLLASTAYMGSIWRSRIRVITITVCLMFLLYSGQPSDLYRMLAALIGLGIGAAFHPRTARTRWIRSSHHDIRVLATSLVVITAVGPVITLLSGRRFGALAPLGLLMSGATPSDNRVRLDCDALHVTRQCLHDLALQRVDSPGPVILTLLPLVMLLVAALGLGHGRRLAAWLTIGVNVGLAALGAYYYGFMPFVDARDAAIPQDPHYWEITLALSSSIVVPLFIAGFVARNLRHFTVRAVPGKVAAYVTVAAAALVGLSGIYLGGGLLMRSQFSPPVTLGDLVSDLPERFVPISFLRDELAPFVPMTPLSSVLYDWIGPIFWLIVIVGALTTYVDRGAHNYAQEVPRVRGMLKRGGGGFLSQWATWKGNSYWFSDDERASVAYRVLAGVAISTSEPIGDEVAARDAIGGFARFCDDHGWIPVFYAIHESFMPSIREMGWRSLVVGEEAVLRPTEWSTAGKAWQDVRTSINRAERSGVRAIWTTYDQLTPAWIDQIASISTDWVRSKPLPEMGFTLGSIEELGAPDVGIMIACDSDDRILGITSWLPSFRDGQVVGWTLDFMRRTAHGMNGVMEFLIARSAERFRDEDAEFMSLSTAPLMTTQSSANGPANSTDRLLAWIANSIEPVYGFRSLFHFKNKFQPELHPIHMAYPDALGLPAIGLALARAYWPFLSVRQGFGFVLRRDRGRSVDASTRKATAPASH